MSNSLNRIGSTFTLAQPHPAAPAPAAAATAPARDLPGPAYAADGSINAKALKNVLDKVGAHAKSIEPGLLALPWTTLGQNTLDKLESHLNTERPTRVGDRRSLDVYRELKTAARQFGMGSRVSKDDEKSDQLQAVADLLTQMARVEYHQRGVSIYDDAADRKTRRMETRLPNFNRVPNHELTDVKSLSIGGGVAVGAGAGGQGAAARLGGALAGTRVDLIAADLDGDMIAGHLVTGSVTIQAGGDVGAGVSKAALSGDVHGKYTRGTITETSNLKQANEHWIADRREGKMKYFGQPSKARKANKSAAGIHGRFATAVKTGLAGINEKFLKSRLPQLDPEGHHLTAEKLQKGVLARSVVDTAPKPDTDLHKALEGAYGAIPLRTKPEGLASTTLRGQWNEVSVGGGLGAGFNLFKDETGTKLLDNITLSAGATGDYAYRWMPAALHMGPHNALDPKLCDDAADKEAALRSAPQFKNYCDYGDHLAGGGNASHAASKLENDLQCFEEASNKLLQGVAMSLSRQGSKIAGPDMATAAGTTLYETFFPNANAQAMAKGATQDPETAIAQCWNALSVGAAIVTKSVNESGSPADQQKLNEVKKRIESPNVTLWGDTLHERSILPFEGELKRHRVQGSVAVQLPLTAKGGFGVATAEVGINAKCDKVTNHPNPLRNGTFVELNVDLTGLPPGVTLAADAVMALALRKLAIHPNFKGTLPELSASASPTILTPPGGQGPNLGLTAGVSIKDANTCTIVLRQGEWGDEKAPGLEVMYVQQSVSRSVNAKAGADVTVAPGLGGNVKLGAASSNGAKEVTQTALTKNSAIHLLQYGNFEKLCQQSGLMDSGGKLTFSNSPEHQAWKAAATPEQLKEMENAQNLLKQMYFTTDAIPGVVKAFQEIQSRGRADPKKRADDFNILGAEKTNKALIAAYLDGSGNHQVLGKALDAVKHVDGRGTDENSRLIMEEYVRGMRAFSAMKGKAYFNEGTNVVSPFRSNRLNEKVALNPPAKEMTHL